MLNWLVKATVTSIAAIGLMACSAIVNPYNSEFQCPDTNKGKCVSVQHAYKESVEGVNNPLVKNKEEKCKDCNQETTPEPVKKPKDPQYSYRNALYKKLASLIQEPSTPVVVPPEVMRVLILSYTGKDNDLFSYRYIYFFATKPKWIISTAKEGD